MTVFWLVGCSPQDPMHAETVVDMTDFVSHCPISSRVRHWISLVRGRGLIGIHFLCHFDFCLTRGITDVGFVIIGHTVALFLSSA